ncbi:hypothetical protein EHQ46_05935 [Leptospira yanagawae]|uniref:Uncharacterized protein n=1 Tax=Leptospira yanagawae TaxID=293069 RepID=A0ABY2M3G7_9LEPT|nr:hypothetical protein [Leptospira yanagawae]TGL23055.1 hypothetical protein EHQ46_05935 [Leptospira yanagawae]
MSILSKMSKTFIFTLQTLAIFGLCYCMPPKNRTVSKEDAIVFLSILINYDRYLDEPNNSFEEAKCIKKSGYVGIYPENDVDYFKFETTDNNITLFIGNYDQFVSQYNLGFQIFDNSRVLIYDIADKSFEVTNSKIITNKTLMQSECLIENCIPLTSYRHLEFSSNIKQIYIKSYAFNIENYSEQSPLAIDAQDNRHINPLDPRKLPKSLGSFARNIFISNYSSECSF